MTVTATAISISNVTANAIVTGIVSGEASSGPSQRAFDFVHRVDHETMTAAAEIWVSIRQTSRYVRSCGVCLPPHAAP